MMKILTLALLGCLCSATLIAPVSAGPNDDKCAYPEDKIVRILDLTAVGQGKYYLIGKAVWKETNTEECWQDTPTYSEGKKRVIQADEQILY